MTTGREIIRTYEMQGKRNEDGQDEQDKDEG